MSVTRRPRPRDERGATLVVLTLVLVLLMGFAAFGVDYANALSQRRLNQGTVDTGTLAAAIETAGDLQAQAIADAEAEAIGITYTSLNLDMTAAEWAAAWATCVDSNKPAIYSVTGTTDCVSFTDTLQRIRIHLPDVDVETGFGGVLGRDVITTSATAVVRLGLSQSGDVLPFGLPSGAAGSGEVCLKQGPSPIPAPPCDGPVTGNFGFLDITRFGNEDPAFMTFTDCNSNIVAENISVGVDHRLDAASTDPTTTLIDRDACQDGAFDSRPDTLEAKPGSGNELHPGFIAGTTGSNPVVGRLTRTPYPTINWAGNLVDDKPLWEFIDPAPPTPPNIPAICEPATFGPPSLPQDWDGDGNPDAPDSHEHMKACIDVYWANPGTYDPLFTLDGDGDTSDEFFDLQRSPRWGWVPEMASPFAGGASGLYPIVRFRPVFIQTFYAGCSAVSCDEWNPSEGSTIAGGKKAVAVTSFVLPDDTLPPKVIATGPGAEGTTTYELIE